MNATVERIVNLLFEDIVMTDETKAIRDEVMNNCQERFAALVKDGYSEDEAIGAVVESLKGMDEVLKDYPRKPREDDGDAFRKGTPDESGMDWSGVRNLRIKFQSADVRVLPTDGEPSMALHDGTNSVLVPSREGDTLVITQEKREGHMPPDTESGYDGRGSFWKWLGRTISRSVEVSLSFGDSDALAELWLPAGMIESAEIQTLSGDITMKVPCSRIMLQSTSGDCRAEPENDGDGPFASFRCDDLTARSISGDVDVTGRFGAAHVSTTSGDIEFRGAADCLELSTVSGDGDAELEGSRVKASSVSGDLEIRLMCGESADAEISSVSGDIELGLPEHVDRVSVKTSTRSGDVEYHNIGLYDDAPVRVKCSTVSGDITVGR